MPGLLMPPRKWATAHICSSDDQLAKDESEIRHAKKRIPYVLMACYLRRFLELALFWVVAPMADIGSWASKKARLDLPEDAFWTSRRCRIASWIETSTIGTSSQIGLP